MKILHNQIAAHHVSCEVASTESPLLFLLHSVLHFADSVCCVHPAATVMAFRPHHIFKKLSVNHELNKSVIIQPDSLQLYIVPGSSSHGSYFYGGGIT